MINRLKEISMKDTLSLDDREYLKNLSKAENEGRFIEIPCKVGDTVYFYRYSLAQKCKVIFEGKCVAIRVYGIGIALDIMSNNMILNNVEWGMNAFSSQKEAKKKLAEKEIK